MSREKKWTPGPWECGGEVHIGIATFDNGQYNVYPPLGESGPIAEVGGKENAALISAAPELVFEVEKSCIRCGWQDDFIGSDIANCPQVKTCGKAKALAKAYGETP